MVNLTGKNLGKRQQDLNKQVNDAANKKVSFDDFKVQTNISDVDMLFKIDLASKYKNLNYIVEILKAGDSLHISRALKCEWLYDDEFSNIMNTDYLHHNIFPYMSNKMKRKLLTAVSIYVTNEQRAASFYIYCINLKLDNIAQKFLISTSESFKLDVIKKSFSSLRKMMNQYQYLKYFVGESYVLAKAYMEELNEYQRPSALYHLRYLFSVSENEYLDLFENYGQTERIRERFGLRLSKHIIKKHKERCLKKSLLYFSVLNKTEISKNLTVDDAKTAAISLLPDTPVLFWKIRYTDCYEFILNVIPAVERFLFLKTIFNHKYPNEEFEMTIKFYNLKCYKFMTREEKESWALRHLETKKEILGEGCDYLWYKFIGFDKSFPEIKKLVRVIKDYNKRLDILKVLIESAQNQRELEQLLIYYYERHVNEARKIKETFISEIINRHNVFEFDSDCWTAFNNILYSVDVYNDNGASRDFITFTALIYHIIHKKDIPHGLKHYVEVGIPWCRVNKNKLYKKINKENQDIVYHYILNIYVDKLIDLDREDNLNKNKIKIHCYIRFILDLLHEHKKTINDCPEIVMKYVNLDFGSFYHYSIFTDSNKVTKDKMFRFLKEDAKIVVEKIPDVKAKIIRDSAFKINQFLKKLKVYFSNDIAKDYLNAFMDMALDKKNYISSVYTAIYGIFQLADKQFIIDFMMKYVPTESKIDHSKIDSQLLFIQGGICRFACYARPPVPLENIHMYIKGDYLRYCLPLFNSYLANLPLPLCLKFVESLIDTPVSIQKHGLRLAFKCFSTENLKKLILEVWKKTQNVSLRLVIYQALYNKIINEVEIEQFELFEVLKSFSLDLRDTDLDEVYSLLTSAGLPSTLQTEYLAIGWQSVNKLSINKTNINRKRNIIENINNKIHLVSFDTVETIVEEHVKTMLIDKQILPEYVPAELNELNKQKWKLVATFIIYFTHTQEFLVKSIRVTELITKSCIEMWNIAHSGIFTFRQFYWQFIDELIEEDRHKGSYECAIPIYEFIIKKMRESLSVRIIYLKVWSLKLAILNRKAKQTGKIEFDVEKEEAKKLTILKQIVLKFSQEVSLLVQDSVNKKEYYSTAAPILQDMIVNNINDIKLTVNRNCDVLILTSDLYVVAASALIEIELMETYLLAINILPTDSPRYWSEDYEMIINKIKASKNEELQYCLYQKFVNCDFKKRKYFE